MHYMVKVDPNLFVTCRLCLEHLGQYQIVPQVQHQIKYCFDIDVGLFDGLPQLLCEKCNTTLQNCYEVKQNFVAKQATLKDKYTKNENQTDDVREGEEGVDKNVNPFGGKRKRCLLPSSCSSHNLEVQNPEQVEPVKKRCKSSKSLWKSFYERKFICQLCSKVCKNKNCISQHLKKHKSLIACYPNVFSRDCKVEMIKVYDDPNMTGSNNTVVYSANRIISNEGSYNHCVIYTPKKSCSGSRLNSSDVCENNQDLVNGDSSDDDIKDSRTRSRTRSSNVTVILNDDNTDGHEQGSGEISDKEENKYFSDGDFIKIVDSSDTESTHSNKRVLRDSADTTTIQAHTSDHKVIQNRINIRCKRCMKKISTESESPAVDIQPKKLANKLNVNKLPGQHVTPINYVFESEENVNGKTSSNVVMPMSISQIDNPQGKLLNESPVAYPKQLPKKTYSNQDSENTDPEQKFEPEDVNGEMWMPIITSIISLAVPSAEAQETPSATDNVEMPNITSNESEKSHPSIKEKPFTKLISERVLKNLNQT